MKKLKIKLKWLNIVTILITFIAYLSPYISPATFWPVSLLGLAYPFLLLLNLLFVLFWLVLLDRYIFFSVGTILMGLGHLLGVVGLKGAWNGKNTANSNSIRIITYNIGNTNAQHKSGTDTSLWEKLIVETDPDIFCFQEFSRRKKNIVAQHFDRLSRENGMKYTRIVSNRLAIFSKFPIDRKRWNQFEDPENGYLWVDLKTDNGTIRVINLHLLSNRITGIVDRLADDNNLQKKRTWQNLKNVVSRYKNKAKVRANQAAVIKESIENSPYPVIVCGDLNDSPLSYTYHLIAQKLQDTFKEGGKGLSFTFAGNIPALRIDYILADPEFRVSDCQVMDHIEYSDHYPVSATIHW